jgi:ABC-type phosphate/phosphonate transport system substrate-binding protein
MPLVANARMYAVTPRVEAAWQALFSWVAKTSNVPLTYLDHPAPAPLETLWARSDLGMVFMCGFPFASAAQKPRLIAAPVPSPSSYCGRPRYRTDFVVRVDSLFRRLPDTFGGRLGWTVRHSQSGYNAVRYHLLRYNQRRSETLFPQWVGPLITPRRAIAAVIEGTIDVAPLDSYVHDLLKRHESETASRLRTVEETVMTAIPPLVASMGVADDTIERLQRCLLSSSTEPQMAPILNTLMLTGFAPVSSEEYGELVGQARAADEGGVPRS